MLQNRDCAASDSGNPHQRIMRWAALVLALALLILASLACSSALALNKPTPIPSQVATKIPSPTAQPSLTPTPTLAPTATLPPLPPLEELLTHFNQVIQPLNDSFKGSGPPPDSFSMPPEDQWQLVLIPMHERFYVTQRLLDQEVLISNPQARIQLYLIYDYDRYGKLVMMPGWIATQGLTVYQFLLAELDGEKYFLERLNVSSGEGAHGLEDMLQQAVVPLEKLGSQAQLVEAALEKIIGASMGLDFPAFSMERRAAWLRWALSSPNWSDQKAAMGSLEALGGETLRAALADLPPLLKSDQSTVVALAVELLWKYGQPDEALPLALRALGNEDWSIRMAVAQSLGEAARASGDPAAVDRLLETLITALQDPDWRLRQGAAWALGETGTDSQQAVAALAVLLDDHQICPEVKLAYSPECVRHTAAVSLGMLGRNALQAVPALIALLESGDESLRQAAVQALERISGQSFGEDIEKWREWYGKSAAGP